MLRAIWPGNSRSTPKFHSGLYGEVRFLTTLSTDDKGLTRGEICEINPVALLRPFGAVFAVAVSVPLAILGAFAAVLRVMLVNSESKKMPKPARMTVLPSASHVPLCGVNAKPIRGAILCLSSGTL